MNGVPDVSIAIRAFRRRWLGEAIASVLAQTHRELELVVYDDAGDLEDVAAGFGDARIRYHRATEKLGVAGRWQAAVALCRGRFVGVLDDDDRYEPAFVERLAARLAANPRAGFAVAANLWDDGETIVPARRDGSGGASQPARELASGRWMIAPSRALFRREIAEGTAIPDDVFTDRFVPLQAAVAGWEFEVVDEPLVITRRHPEMLSLAGLPSFDRLVATWEQAPVGDDPELDRLRRGSLASTLVSRAGWRLVAGDTAGARDDLARSAAADAATDRWKRRALGLATSVPGLARPVLQAWVSGPGHVSASR